MDVSAIEPLLPEDRQELEDLATDLLAKIAATRLVGGLKASFVFDDSAREPTRNSPEFRTNIQLPQQGVREQESTRDMVDCG